MHELFAQVLSKRDLTRAGDLFSLSDGEIENDLSVVTRKLDEIASQPDYVKNDNDQSVVEICITRVVSAVRENSSIERHSPALLALLQSCLARNLRPSGKDEDSPHAKIASEILSCLFMNYSVRSLMEATLPVAVKSLHHGNRDINRNMSSYLSLVAIEHSDLLAKQVQFIIDSILAGNNSLLRVLPQLYIYNHSPIIAQIHRLLSAMPDLEEADKLSLLQLCKEIAKDKPRVLEPHVAHLCKHLSAPTCVPLILSVFVDMAAQGALPLASHVTQLKQVADSQTTSLEKVAQILGAMGRTNMVLARDCMGFLSSRLPRADVQAWQVILSELTKLADLHPSVLAEFVSELSALQPTAPPAVRSQLQMLVNRSSASLTAKTQQQQQNLPSRKVAAAAQTEGTVTVITVGDPDKPRAATRSHVTVSIPDMTQRKHASTSTRDLNAADDNASDAATGMTSTANLKDAVVATDQSSTAKLTRTASRKSMTSSRTNVASSKSNLTTREQKRTVGSLGRSSHANLGSRINSVKMLESNSQQTDTSVNPPRKSPSTVTSSAATVTSAEPQQTPAAVALLSRPKPSSAAPASSTQSLIKASPIAVPDTTKPDASNGAYRGMPHAIPFRDAVQQFCEKHLETIKKFVEAVQTRIPIPIKATTEESKNKRQCKLHFICFGRGENCLYSTNFFTHRTRHARTWVHLIFLAIQARSDRAVSQQDPSVGNLKACWDTLRLETGNSFVRLVTSNFPSPREQEMLLQELTKIRFFDIFEYDPPEEHWVCFMCKHPEMASDILTDGNPKIEGQLQEKRGRWKFLKRWKTRYFTLSGTAITYNKKDTKAALPVSNIRSVKAIKRGVRDIPRAFELFTSDETYVFKAQDSAHAQQWLHALQVALAQAQKRDVTAFDIKGWTYSAPSSSKRGATGTETQTKL